MSDFNVGPELVCPACASELIERASYECSTCRRSYPVVAGILDLRLAPDRYLSLADDRRKAERIAAIDGTAADLVEAYWAMTPEVPPNLAASYRKNAAWSVGRGAAVVDRLQAMSTNSLLDVGCGTGGLVVAAAQRGMQATGIDVALRWLVVCARLAKDHNVSARFISADGSLPPFRLESFDFVTCIETLEHAADPRGTLQRSIALSKVKFLAVSANRFSAAPDPTLNLMMTGFLPRSLAASYVRRRRKTGAVNYAPPSTAEINAWLGPSRDGAMRTKVTASVLPPVSADASGLRRRGVHFHDQIVNGRLEPFVRMCAPMIEVSVAGVGDGPDIDDVGGVGGIARIPSDMPPVNSR